MGRCNFFKDSNKFKILLLTHISADNIGDQTIELCSNSLVRACFKNLGLDDNYYEILSLDAAFVNSRFLAHQSANQIDEAEQIIKEADLIIFGGAPMFNYTYEGFAERTAKTLDIINFYKKPVIFSAIGVESFDEDNYACKHLKNALNSKNVKMITTRDNIDALKCFVEGTDISIAKVSDPAVFCSNVLDDVVTQKSNKSKKKKIGVFVIRGNAFKDNRISFDKDQAIEMWLELAEKLEKKGYDYEFLTSGSHNDEAFLDKLIVEYGLDKDHCVTNLVTPEELATRISSYDGMISCRLHPSIIAYSYKVPTVGVVWNNKVTSFYENIGYPERVLQVEDITVKKIIDTLDKAMKKGVSHDKEFLMTSYEYLFNALKSIVAPRSKKNVYSYKELIDNLVSYEGSDIRKKMDWKMARVYRTFNSNLTTSQNRAEEINKLNEDYEILLDKYNILKDKMDRLRNVLNDGISLVDLSDYDMLIQSQIYPMYYNIGKKMKSLTDNVNSNYSEDIGMLFERPNSIELVLNDNDIKNDGNSCFYDNVFKIDGFKFIGWRLRISIFGLKYVLSDKNKFINKDKYDMKKHGTLKVFNVGDKIPVIPFDGILNVVAEGVWEKE